MASKIIQNNRNSDYEDFELGNMSREEYDRSLTTKCIGCIEDMPNQLAHMDPGGCLYSSSEDEEPNDEQWLCKQCFIVYGKWDGETSICDHCLLNEPTNSSDSSLDDPSYKPSQDTDTEYTTSSEDSDSDYMTSSEDTDKDTDKDTDSNMQ